MDDEEYEYDDAYESEYMDDYGYEEDSYEDESWTDDAEYYFVLDTGTGEVYVGRWLQERAVLDPDDYPGKWGLWKAGDVRKAGAGFVEIRTGG